ncbi:MAG: polymorphic toxin type 44 domain-containing protein [Pseudanabaena sp.]
MAERSSAIFWVLNCPIYLLRCYSIRASSNGGAGNTIKLTSLMGKIDTNGGLISSTSHAGGNAGAITLNSAKDIKVGDIFARSRDGEVTTTGVWNGGRVTLDAGGNIESGNITTTSITGNAGKVTLEAGGDIEAGAIASNTFDGSGKGGNISLISDRGNIQIDYARSDSAGGKSGNITLDANKKFVKVTGAINIEGRPTSVYSGDYQKGSIIIKHGGGSQLILFKVGDSSVNGTFAEIQGKEGIYSKSIFPKSFSWKGISIITDSSPLTDAFTSTNNSFLLLSTASGGVTFPSSIPPGVRIDDNIRIAIQNNSPVWNPFWFRDKVKNGGVWDYKQLNRAYEDFGNFNYGATGRAFGFSDITLLQEAGIAQVQAGTSRPEWGNPGTRLNPFDPGIPPYGDDPNDQYWIKEGIRYYDEVYARNEGSFYRQFEVFPTDYNFRLF